MGRLTEELPLDQRLARYREFADEALRCAAQSHDGETRAIFLSMAAGWRTLADDIERAMTRIDALEQGAPGRWTAGKEPRTRH